MAKRELVIYQGRDYTWGWDDGKPPQLALQLTDEGCDRLKAVFGDKPLPVTMTVEEGEPERITVRQQ
jgi:hypothetical protein